MESFLGGGGGGSSSSSSSSSARASSSSSSATASAGPFKFALSPSAAASLFGIPNRHSIGGSRFLHNGRLFLGFFPCLMILAAFGGKWVISSIVIGTLLTYIADLFGSKAGCLVCIWTTLAATELSLVEASVALIRESFVNIAFLFNVVFFIVLVGVWFCLNLELAILDLNPFILSAMERMLFACFPFPAIVLLTWGTIAIFGIDYASYYLCAYVCLYYLGFSSTPLPSSWPQAVSKPTEGDKPGFKRLNGPVENMVQTLVCAVLPATFHLAVYYRVIFSIDQLATLSLLFIVPNLVIVAQPDSFYWITNASFRTKIKKLIATVGAIVLLGCIEYRIIFHSFYHFIATYPPWSYIFVTAALYSLSYFVVAHFTDFVSKPDKNLSLGVACIAALAISLVLGTPIYFLPFPVLNAYFFVNYYFHRKFIDYVLFLVTVTLFLAWFMRKTFFFIDYQFGTISLQLTATLLGLLFVYSFFIIGVAVNSNNQNLLGLLLLIHGIGVSTLESILQQSHEPVYPGYMIAFTSLAGTYLACRLETDKRISNNFTWLIASLYMSKLSLLMSPYQYVHIAAFALVANISPLYYFYRAPTMKRHLGMFHAIAIGIAAFATKSIIPAKIYELYSGNAPSDSQCIAFFFIIWGVGCLPLSLNYFTNLAIVRSINLLIIAIGILFAVIQPEFGLSLFSSIFSGTSGSGFEQLHLSKAAQWMLIIVLVLSLASFTSLLPMRRSENVRVIYSVVCGACLGLFFAGTYLPFSLFIYICYSVLFTLLVTFLVFVQFPTQRSVNFTSWIYFMILALSILLWTGITQSFKDASINPKQRLELLSYTRVVTLSIYVAINIIIALFLKFKVSEFTPSTGQRPAAVAPPRSARQATNERRIVQAPEDWMPTVGNMASIIALVLGIVLNIYYFHGTTNCIFVLSPLLLLLNKDRYLFKDLAEKNRYFPIIVVTSAFLTFAVIHEVWIAPFLPSAYVNLGGNPLIPFTLWGAIKNMVLLAMALPSNYYFNIYLYNLQRQDETIWLIVTPLNILPLVFGDVSAICVLGLVGLMGGLVSFYVSRQIKLSGLKAL